MNKSVRPIIDTWAQSLTSILSQALAQTPRAFPWAISSLGTYGPVRNDIGCDPGDEIGLCVGVVEVLSVGLS